jgi:hypothetical protein
MGKKLLTIVSRPPPEPTQSPKQLVAGTISPEVKTPRLEAGYSTPSSVEIKNA